MTRLRGQCGDAGKAQPRDLDASEIDVRLGATWISRDYIQQFMEETFETPWRMRSAVQVQYSPATAEWQVTSKNATGRHDVMAYMTYGTDRASAYRILEDTLNLRDVRIYDIVEDADGKQKRVLNKKGDHPCPAEAAGHQGRFPGLGVA